MKYFVPGVNVKVLGKVVHCLAKVGDEVAFDFEPDSLTLRTVNISRSAFATFTFGSTFFSNIEDAAKGNQVEDDEEGICCKIMVRSLLLAFRSLSNLDRTVECCTLEMDQQKCKLMVSFHCRYSVSRSYSLAMIEDDNLKAVYDINQCCNKWTVDSKVIQEANGNFLANQEEVTMQVTAEHFNIKNYNDSMDEKMHINTEFSMQPREFELFQINEDTNVTFCLKEFRSLLLFSEYLNIPITVNFSVGGHPLVFSASQGDFLTSTYVLASLADDGSSQPAVKTPQAVKKKVPRPDCPPPLIHHSTQLDTSRVRPSQTICTPDISTIPPASVPLPNFNTSSSLPLHEDINPHEGGEDNANEEECLEASPPGKKMKKNFFFRRCFDATWNPNKFEGGSDKVLAPDSDEDN